MIRVAKLVAVAALACTGVSAQAAVSLNFEQITPHPSDSTVSILEFYNGGTASNGVSGPNVGVSFAANAKARCLNTATVRCPLPKPMPEPSRDNQGGAKSRKGGLSTPDPSTFANVGTGFSDALAFYYVLGDGSTGDVSVFSGLNGSGTLLGQLTLAPNAVGCLPELAELCPFQRAAFSFSGVAHSVVFAGTLDQIAFDDVTLGVPEPANWALMIIGFGVTGAALRRRRAAFA